MTVPIPFTDNYTDHSTELGYQFEFFCERCGNGYKSGFNASAVGIGGKIARGLGGMFGGALGNIGVGADQAKDLTESKAKDDALRKAVEEMRPLFNQCHKCGQWVCKEICWNEEFQLCVNDAPKLEQELAGMQSARRLQQVQEKVGQADYASDVNVERKQVALCPNCGAEAPPSGKFCANCGQALDMPVTCGKCGSESPRGTKFCPECGNNLAA
ncbi:MAG TPA: zinc ribbon domain-containing protein [Actinomycetota bacterium]|nr:zinc ribbon domain-containing protein [Actinomycetota bacterium]